MSVWKTDEYIKNSPDYITRSKITRTECNKMGIPSHVPVDEVKAAFDDIVPRVVVTGSPYNKNQQRHTCFVSKYQLYRKVINKD